MSNKIYNQDEFGTTGKNIKRAFIVVFLLWALSVLVSMTFVGVIIWAIIKLVSA